MAELLKMGVIGAGVFAGYHANKLAEHPGIDFIGVHDPDAERAGFGAQKHGVKAMSATALYVACDAVVIACPASYHGEMAIGALRAGCHCLIEKPIATSVAEAEAIRALADDANRIAQIGHQERLVAEAIGLHIISEKPLRIEAIRANPYSLRGTDTSVTMDLMTHDIDLCTMLFGGAPLSVRGEAGRVRSATPDMAYGILSYPSGKAYLLASRVAEQGKRVMTITYESGEIVIDFNAKTLTNTTTYKLNAEFRVDPIAKDSLGAATNRFVRAVLDGDPVLVSAGDGLIAARVATEIDRGTT